MYKELSGLAMALVIANNASAFEIHGGRVVDQQEWTSASQQIEVKDSVRTKSRGRKISKFNQYSQHSSGRFFQEEVGILLKNKLSDEIGAVGEVATMPGSTEVYIENLGSIPHTINIASNFCLSEDGSCAHNSFTIELDPQGVFQFDANHSFTHKFDETGNYGAYFTIAADVEGSTTYFSTYDEATISIVNP